MNKCVGLAVLSALLISGSFAANAANENTISIGYAQSNVKVDGNDVNGNPQGVNLKYRNEFNDKFGLVVSTTYTNKTYDYYSRGSKVAEGKLKYYSTTLGPSYRLNDYSSVYALIGVGYGEADASILNYSESNNKTSVAYGAGFQINPVKNWAIDASYEYSKLGDYKVGTWTLGAGYRF